ncbi:MAG: NAD(P)-dependent oxidoreductase [Haloferacaceae archaeon]
MGRITDGPDVVVLREGTEGLGMEPYAEALAERLDGFDVALARTPAEERDLAADAPVVTGVGVDDELLDAAEALRLFACVFSGTDHVPADRLAASGAALTNAGGIHAPGIAEQVLAYCLTFARRLHVGHRRRERREWRHYRAGELKGSTVTVVGLGAIGTETVARLEPFDVETLGVRYTPSKGSPTDEVFGFDEVHDALARTDYLVVACPLTDATRGLVDAAAFATLPPDAVVVNVARGGVVDTDALVDALGRNGIRGAAVDVTDPEPLPPEHPLWRMDNCLITPHVGGSTPRHWDRMADIAAHNVRVVADGGAPADLRNLVRAPETDAWP